MQMFAPSSLNTVLIVDVLTHFALLTLNEFHSSFKFQREKDTHTHTKDKEIQSLTDIHTPTPTMNTKLNKHTVK